MTFLNYFLDITITGNLKYHLLLNYYHIDRDAENEKVTASFHILKYTGIVFFFA